MYTLITEELSIKINTDKIQEKNKELIKKNLYKNLEKKEKYVMEKYKGPPHGIDKFGLNGYVDFTNYFINKNKFVEIHIKDIPVYATIFGLTDKYDTFNIYLGNFEEKIKHILNTINKKRIENIQKYIRIMDNVIKKGIKNNSNILFRVMTKEFSSNIIYNFTSWSLYPLLWFGATEQIFHIYIAKLSNKIKSFYVEYDGNDKELENIKKFPFYEYEFILPKNIEFKKTKTITKNINLLNFGNKKQTFSEHTVHIHYIKIFKVHKYINNEITQNPILTL